MGQLNNEDWEHVDIAALISGAKGDGVVSGLAVSESAIPAMSVLVESGSCHINYVTYTEGSSQNLNISNGDVTHPRKDIIIYDATAGNPAVVEGTPAAAPVPPDIPSGDIYLALVHVAANESTSIDNVDIDEGRVYVTPLPTGLIMMWHGTIANIPSGWTLCDGTSGTPDLRSRFVRGAPAATNPGSTGGADTHTLTEAEMPVHDHSIWKSQGTGTHDALDSGSTASTPQSQYCQNAGSGNSHNNMPAYYEIAYIMKT